MQDKEKIMKLYICIDDTDDLTKETSTGKISDLIAKEIIKMGGTLIKGVTRHQLLLHDDIKYTSHNSAMCMVVDVVSDAFPKIKEAGEKILRENMAESSDPGICFCVSDRLNDPSKLMVFGRKAQKEVITKEEAYDLAHELDGVILEEYGGRGLGIIGALSGVGLRMTGCDGTFRGGKDSEFEGQSFSVKKWKEMTDIEQVVDFEGNILADHVDVKANDQLKLAHLDHKKTLIAKEKDGQYIACKKKDIYDGNRILNTWNTSCPDFESDNDIEEQYDNTSKACYNCLYRRWTTGGFECVKRGT